MDDIFFESSREAEDALDWLQGIGTGAAAGATAGAVAGPWGAAIGGVIGAGLGAAQTAAAQDRERQQRRQPRRTPPPPARAQPAVTTSTPPAASPPRSGIQGDDVARVLASIQALLQTLSARQGQPTQAAAAAAPPAPPATRTPSGHAGAHALVEHVDHDDGMSEEIGDPSYDQLIEGTIAEEDRLQAAEQMAAESISPSSSAHEVLSFAEELIRRLPGVLAETQAESPEHAGHDHSDPDLGLGGDITSWTEETGDEGSVFVASGWTR
jgi:hypothetical protein